MDDSEEVMDIRGRVGRQVTNLMFLLVPVLRMPFLVFFQPHGWFVVLCSLPGILD